jgi:hypothetical protein
MGKQSRVPPAKLQVKVDRPGFPPLVQEYLYNGYRLNTNDKLERFETEIMEDTRRSIGKKFALSYTCE